MATTLTVVLNPAFLREIKEDDRRLRELLSQLRSHFELPPHPARCAEGLELLAACRDQLATHFTLEEAYGYFEDPIEAAPQLCQAAEALLEEHGPLFAAFRELADAAEQAVRDRDLAASWGAVAERFALCDMMLQEHESRENELIRQGLQQDIGVGD